MGNAQTKRLTRRGLRLAQFTVAYNLVEGVVTIIAGFTAGLVSLIGFGFDSGIESATAILVALRLASRIKNGQADERKERRTLRYVSVSFFVLAAWVVFAGIRDLVLGSRPNASPVGVGALIASVIVMPILVVLKRRVGKALNDPLILADAAETRLCIMLSVSTLLGLVLYAITGATWIDAVSGFIIAIFAANEGREAWHGQLDEDEHATPEARRR